MCVPTELLEKAANLFRAQTNSFESFRSSALSRVEGMEHLYPRFKFVGTALFFILMSSQACHLECESNDIEHSQTGVPYPKLPVYAQSLLETWNLVGLDDLVDRMNLTLEWGEANLDSEGTIDAEWGRWKADALYRRKPDASDNGKACVGDIPLWRSDPKNQRDIWESVVSPQAKRTDSATNFFPSTKLGFGNLDKTIHAYANETIAGGKCGLAYQRQVSLDSQQ
jgi:hypothetical protein